MNVFESTAIAAAIAPIPLTLPFLSNPTRSSQASTSASTLDQSSCKDALESLGLCSSTTGLLRRTAGQDESAVGTSRPPFLSRSSNRTAVAMTATSSTSSLTPTEQARARAYDALHGGSPSTSTAASSIPSSHPFSSREMSDKGQAEKKATEEQDPSHHAGSGNTHHASNTAFLITYFVAGGAAGATSRTVVSPLERLKIIMQVQPQQTSSSSSAASKKAYSGVWTGLVKMWREEGFAGFMRGNGINCLRIAPYSAVQFTTYELCKNWLRADSLDEHQDLDVVRKLTAGAIAGIASVVSTYPLDLVRSRISIASANMYNEAKSVAAAAASDASTKPASSGSSLTTKAGPIPPQPPAAKVSQEVLRAEIAAQQKKVPGIVPMTLKVYREEGGFRGLYRGCVPTSVGVAPYVALNFYFYEGARKYMLPLDGSEPSSITKLACGALAGSISQTLTYPLDVLRRRMQVAGMKDGAEKLGYKDKSALNAISNIIKAEGIKGLYRGLLPNLLKVAPSIGTSFLTYEAVKGFLELHMDDLHLTSHDHHDQEGDTENNS